MGWPVRDEPLQQTLPPGSRLGPRWRPMAWQGRTTVGIDLGGGSLKLVQLSWNRQGACLETFAWVPLPVPAVDEGGVLHTEEVARLIRSVCHSLGLRQRQVTACVGGIGVLMRTIAMPAIPLGELVEAMRYEAPQALPIPEEHLVYDFTALEDQAELPQGQMNVFVAGTNRNLVESYQQTFSGARLRLIALDLECLTVLRTLEATGRLKAGSRDAIVLLDCGETTLGLTVIRHGVPLLTRHIPGGFGEMRAQVAEQLELSLAEVQSHICAEGLAAGGMVASAALPWLRRAVDGLARSIEFFLIQNRGTGVERIFLYGPWAAIPHLVPALQAMFQELLGHLLEGADPIRVQMADLAGFPMAPEVEAGALAAGAALLPAVGAALRGVADG